LIKGRTYPWDYEKYAARPEIGENEIRDFLRSKEFDQEDTDYLLKSLKGG
jgi:sigma54-dependent transcription regulator